ncbi:hypothetical protein NNJEOMEG_00757 [Fundidesulfovibrio magnetotacticus]|uniref:Calcineurin-like phosphoesterase domain-containing protein n=1 Tax=Fundidesulfovibrio magnetotacticus TaxID=2730080 RepID=A0A6V8LS45_9BACT|nr:metallophosphoesterase [Fundidesulfovibrio magnetotacticus]GFK92929.1 hypothetical protein NNJEOMEG_00757 [Fundidesulfovibrio magnetotacticus]
MIRLKHDAHPDRRTFLRLLLSGLGAGAAALAVPPLGLAAKPGDPAVLCTEGDPASFTASDPASRGRFLIFSDVHFDPFADPSRVKALAAAPAGSWREILAAPGQGLGPYGKDTGDALFQSFLDDMARRLPDPDFLLFPGDMLCHDFWTLYPRLSGDASPQGLLAFIAKTAEYFLTEVTRRFPGASLYPALGNNDSAEGDYGIAPQSPFLLATAPLAARLALKDDASRARFLESYPRLGCYSLTLPGPAGARLVVFNNIFWTKRSPHQDAGAAVRDFLERELDAAARQGVKVWLMGHVPPGDNTKATATKFRKTGKDVYDPLLTGGWSGVHAELLVRHADTVRASLAGHVHRDEFRLVSPWPGEAPVSALRMAPSISPITGNNPGYQVYAYDRRTMDLLDQTTHYLDLGAQSPAWAEEYVWSRAYGRGLRAPKDWQEMYQELLTCPERRAAFARGFDLRSRHVREVTRRTFPVVWDSLGLSPGGPAGT